MAFPSDFGRIVIAGVGLIGGSIGLSLKKAGFRGEIIGLGRKWDSLKRAINTGAVDHIEIDFAKALKDANILIIGTPVDTIADIVGKAIEHLPKGCIITDVGSTKAKLVCEIEKIIPDDIYFVGGHPMAGSHETSVDFADADLFVNKICILTPTDKTNKDAIKIITDLWQMIGASTKMMPPDDHDYLVSAISHLPHTVACALVNAVSEIKNAQGNALDFAASGFADATRIASGSPDLWKGILLQNAENLILMINKVESELAKFRSALEAKNGDSLLEILTHAKHIRDSFKR